MAVPFVGVTQVLAALRGTAGAAPPRAAPLSSVLRDGRVRIRLPEAELVPLVVLADREPAHRGHGDRVTGLATELRDPRGAGVDVVDVEVGSRAACVRVLAVDRAARVLGEAR